MASNDTTKAATTDTKTRLYFEGLSAEAITAKLRGQAKRVTTDIETFGGMIVEAYARQVHVQLDQTWAEFTSDVLAGFKPDTLSRKLLGAMMRAAGMENKEVADATGATERTIERDNAERGEVNPAKQASNKAAAKSGTAKPDTLTDAIVISYLRNFNDHAHVAAILRAAGYGTLLVPEYRHEAKSADAKPSTRADVAASLTKATGVRSVRTAGKPRRVLASVK